MLRRVLMMFALLLPLSALAETFVAGKDYELIKGNEVTAQSGPVTVTEFFSYGCPWCYRLEPSLTQWIKQQGDQIQFSRVPVVFNKDWSYYAKAYYTVNLLGQGAKLNPILFKTIQAKHGALTSNDTMIDFLTSQGIDKATAESAFKHSTTIDMQLNQGSAQMAQFHITAVPAVVINGQYKTDLQMAQGEDRLFKILDYLVQQAAKKESHA
ncbi:thioredoxin domain-containing protein [Legionella sp. MW5194]|uniref:thiol:disulfide interchange protein DsbA/DsbL n=1 Tax=Legionella sp. MW5194 TaxID=2662448 RepID=UPI00193D4311|nr:thiol:disulfide interchange protein DsbA/DsbL [Legionella sp. MW5194]QRN02530.1 thioredoxin domain-containing protein [Legionella sp. MW5194]